MPIVCALVPSYRAAVARARRPELRERPLIVVDRLERGHVLDLDPEAFTLGARAGMTLVQAAACAREAEVVVDDPADGRRRWDAVLDALDAASPLVEDAEPGTAFLEMRGIPGSPERLLASVRAALAGDGGAPEAAEVAALPFAIALGPNPFVARAAARRVARDPAAVRCIGPAEAREFLAPLPLHELGLDLATIERLTLFGIRSLGELAALPYGPFVRRFGPRAAAWHDRAGGIDDRPLVPRPRALRIERARFGEGTADREDQVLFALRGLVRHVADDVAYAGRRCGRLRLHLECEDGEVHELAVTLAQPTALERTMFDLLRARLEGVRLGAPVVGLRLGAERLEEGGAMLSLFATDDPDPEAVAIAVERIRAALGEDAARSLRVVPAFRREAASGHHPFSLATRDAARLAASGSARERPASGVIAYRVLAPRAIEVTLRRGIPERVDGRLALEVAGPWRTDEGWWHAAFAPDGTHTRSDAYDVLLDDGSLVRIDSRGERWSLRGSYE